MSGPLVANLGIGPNVWLFLSLLTCLTLFFKFNRVWSIRNLDLLLLFALAPGMMMLVGSGGRHPLAAFLWMFAASALWLLRSLFDLGLARRPLLEPNLNAAGLTCLAMGILGLMVAETVNLTTDQESVRNPADTKPKGKGKSPGAGLISPSKSSPGDSTVPVDRMLRRVLSPTPLRERHPHLVLSRVSATLAHIGLFVGLWLIGVRHFERSLSGLAPAACYLLLPYTRIALVDTVQLVPAALVIAAILVYDRPAWAGAWIGLASGWMPACLALVPLWFGFYRGSGAWRFALVSLGVLVVGAIFAALLPGLSDWFPVLDAPTLIGSGIVPFVVAPESGSIWSGIEPAYRLPVLVVYLALVVVTSFLPRQKDLGALISLSAALLVASQYWYLAAGGMLVLLYQPLVLLMMFRPNLSAKRPAPPPKRHSRETSPATIG